MVAVRLLAAAVFQGGDPAVDGADVRLQGAHAAVDGRDRAAEGVEGRHQRVAAVALGLAEAVRLDLDMTLPLPRMAPPVRGGRKSRLLMKFGVNCSWTRWKRPLPSATAGFRAKYLASSGAKLLLLRYRPSASALGVAGELERGVREDGGGCLGRPGQECLDHRGRHVGAHQGLEASVGADREVARVCLRLGQEARAGDGVVDLGLGPPAGPVLQEGGRELGVQLRAG